MGVHNDCDAAVGLQRECGTREFLKHVLIRLSLKTLKRWWGHFQTHGELLCDTEARRRRERTEPVRKDAMSKEAVQCIRDMLRQTPSLYSRELVQKLQARGFDYQHTAVNKAIHDPRIFVAEDGSTGEAA